jgi:hypothetical protein
MKNIFIYSNCAGNIIKNMFEKHSFTKDKYFISYISNYENLNKEKIDDSHIYLLSNCDIFIYQPFNQHYIESEYDITNIKKYLHDNTIILKINYYRFRGFWYNSEYKPYNNYNNYTFLNMNYYGIHDSFINFNTTDKNDIIDKINNIQIPRDELLLFFDNELIKFKIIDDNSDINMFEYFINNYKIKQLFHDPFHPTNLFFYEIFRQIIIKLDNYELKYEDYDFIDLFNNIEMTHFALPILPIVKNILDIKLTEYFYIFHPPDYGDKKIYMDIYDYYYIRLSHQNFKNYLDNLK